MKKNSHTKQLSKPMPKQKIFLTLKQNPYNFKNLLRKKKNISHNPPIKT